MHYDILVLTWKAFLILFVSLRCAFDSTLELLLQSLLQWRWRASGDRVQKVQLHFTKCHVAAETRAVLKNLTPVLKRGNITRGGFC